MIIIYHGTKNNLFINYESQVIFNLGILISDKKYSSTCKIKTEFNKLINIPVTDQQFPIIQQVIEILDDSLNISKGCYKYKFNKYSDRLTNITHVYV